MAQLLISPSKLRGTLTIPPSKSHTLRAILFAALAKGISKIENYLLSPDTTQMVEAIKLLGARVTVEPSFLIIEGFDGKPEAATDVIQCGNSGIILRFLGALAGLIPSYTLLTGDLSLRTHRPAQALLEGLTQLGAFAESSLGNGRAPLLIKGPLTQSYAKIEGSDSQPVSGLLIAAAFAPHPIQIEVENPGEKPWIDLTLDWFKKLQIPYLAQNHTHYEMKGSSQIQGFSYKVPGDMSTAAFPIAAALLTHSELTLHQIDMDDVQGDKILISILEKMGAQFLIDKTNQILHVKKTEQLHGIQIDVNDCIDALPILAVIGCFAKGRTEIVNGAMARLKESDRIASICCELKKMGALIEEKPDGLIIESSLLKGACLDAHQDHRIALSLAVAALAASSPSQITGTEWINKTYSQFQESFTQLGAKMRTASKTFSEK